MRSLVRKWPPPWPRIWDIVPVVTRYTAVTGHCSSYWPDRNTGALPRFDCDSQFEAGSLSSDSGFIQPDVGLELLLDPFEIFSISLQDGDYDDLRDFVGVELPDPRLQ